MVPIWKPSLKPYRNQQAGFGIIKSSWRFIQLLGPKLVQLQIPYYTKGYR